MKKTMLIASLVYASLMSCNNAANDGDAATDTTNTTGAVPQSDAPYGDTTRDLNDQGTKTSPGMVTSMDSMSNSNRPADSTGGLGNGVKDRTPISEGQN